MNELVILTPTYNRAHKLPILYESLKKQNTTKFVWCIIDDGSIDGTKDYVDEIKKENIIKINYHYQKNGGKSRALNRGFQIAKNAILFAIVDSDDYLLPTAVDTLTKYLNKYKYDENIGSLFFYYNSISGDLLKEKGKIIKGDVITSRFEYDKKYGSNDGCMCYFKKVIDKYKYPEFNGETYVGPTVIQMAMANEYKIVFSPEVIGVAEYLSDGLTSSGRLLRIKNPLGMIYYSGLQQSKQSPVLKRIKHTIGAQAYRFYSNKNMDSLKALGLSYSLKKWAYFPGFLLKKYWDTKYNKGTKYD